MKLVEQSNVSLIDDEEEDSPHVEVERRRLFERVVAVLTQNAAGSSSKDAVGSRHRPDADWTANHLLQKIIFWSCDRHEESSSGERLLPCPESCPGLEAEWLAHVLRGRLPARRHCR